MVSIMQPQETEAAVHFAWVYSQGGKMDAASSLAPEPVKAEEIAPLAACLPGQHETWRFIPSFIPSSPLDGVIHLQVWVNKD